MDVSREEQQRQAFCNILFDLAQSQLSLKGKNYRSKIYQQLEKLYYAPEGKNAFRHFYSDIFSVLTQIQSEDISGSIDILGQNLLEIRKGYQVLNTDENGNPIDISDSIRKLYDHINLDIARIKYSDAADWKRSHGEVLSDVQAQVNQIHINLEHAEQIQDSLKAELEHQQSDYHAQVDQINVSIQEAKKAQCNLEKELAKQQREYIAILGIFAAVVLAFTGGIAFSTSVLENIAGISIYRIIIITLLIGIVLTNVLFGLFYYIDRLVNGPEHKTLKPLWMTNFFLLFLIITTIMAWTLGIVENRNHNIQSKSETSNIITLFKNFT